MPDISPETRQEIERRLNRYLKARDGYDEPTYIASGGSAATYAVSSPSGKRAIKVYDPRFLSGATSDAEKRRLDLQRSLIEHSCPQLVTVYTVDEAEGTAFIEMEFVEWPRLKDALPKIPDESVSMLIHELVVAVVYLEKRGIVHRDIKPENIHVSPTFEHIKLLDLGVARTIDVHEDDSGEGTDQGSTRPFIATAQYSSPEYLFRLDEPSPNLWKALNLYQVGAVLHDLINKRPLFQDEVEKANRWLVARAVLEKTPTFPDTNPLRLSRQKALALRCLAKDGTIRIQIASWTDFSIEAPVDGISSLQAKLAKEKGTVGAQSLDANKNRIDFERRGYAGRISDAVRSILIAACNQQIAISMYPDESSLGSAYIFDFEIDQPVKLHCKLGFIWNDGLLSKEAAISLSAILVSRNTPLPEPSPLPISAATISESEDICSSYVADQIAKMIEYCIDIVGAADDSDSIHGIDIAFNFKAKE